MAVMLGQLMMRKVCLVISTSFFEVGRRLEMQFDGPWHMVPSYLGGPTRRMMHGIDSPAKSATVYMKSTTGTSRGKILMVMLFMVFDTIFLVDGGLE